MADAARRSSAITARKARQIRQSSTSAPNIARPPAMATRSKTPRSTNQSRSSAKSIGLPAGRGVEDLASRGDARDEGRREEREEHGREQELPGPRADGHGPEERPDRGDADGAEQHHDGKRPGDRRKVHVKEKGHERDDDDLDRQDEGQHPGRLSAPDCRPRNGRDEEADERRLLALALPAPPERQDRREHDREPERPGRDAGRRLGARGEGHARQDRHERGEEGGGRDDLARGHLDAQILEKHRDRAAPEPRRRASRVPRVRLGIGAGSGRWGPAEVWRLGGVGHWGRPPEERRALSERRGPERTRSGDEREEARAIDG